MKSKQILRFDVKNGKLFFFRNNYLMNGDYLNGSLDNAKPEDNDDKELPKSTERQQPQRDQLVVDEVDADMIEAPPQAPSQPSAASEIIDDEMVSQEEEESEPQPSVPMATEDVTEASEEATKEVPEPDRSEEAKKEVPEPVPESKPIRTFGPVTRSPSMFIDNLPEAKEEEKVETNSTQDENVQVQDQAPVEEEETVDEPEKAEEAVDEPEKAEEVVDEPKKEEKESEQPEAPTPEEDASTDSKVDSEETAAAAKET